MTRGRFVLGVGVSHRETMEGMLGLPLRAPLATMREYVGVLRGALGEGADFAGEHYRAHWSLALPRRPAPPRVYLGALSRRMLELAGELADGAVLWLCAPAYVRDVAVPALTRGRARAGLTLDGFEIVAAVPLAVTDDPAAARRAFGAELTRYLALPFYRAMLEASGLGDGVSTFDREGTVPDALVDRKSTRLNSSHVSISYAVFCLKQKTRRPEHTPVSFGRARYYQPSPPSCQQFLSDL